MQSHDCSTKRAFAHADGRGVRACQVCVAAIMTPDGTLCVRTSTWIVKSCMEIILAPSKLGLRPLHPDHEPGTWRAPAVLMANGLAAAVGASASVSLPRPA